MLIQCGLVLSSLSKQGLYNNWSRHDALEFWLQRTIISGFLRRHRCTNSLLQVCNVNFAQVDHSFGTWTLSKLTILNACSDRSETQSRLFATAPPRDVKCTTSTWWTGWNFELTQLPPPCRSKMVGHSWKMIYKVAHEIEHHTPHQTKN
jgi:hypothetical protein